MLDASDFYAGVPRFDGFGRILDDALYRPLPDDWMLGLSDVVRSTEAISTGGYKAVNTAGAAVIAAVRNALPGIEFPFVFGGDGSSFAIPAIHAEKARHALQATAAWVRDELGLGLRIAMISVGDIRATGRDVRVARYAASAAVDYAMFAGGGLGWAEAEMKAGRLVLAPGAEGDRPDLSGLSCRWGEIPSRAGIILSLIVAPRDGADMAAFRSLVEEVIDIAGSDAVAGRPVPMGGPSLRWPPTGLDLEARASRRAGGSLNAAKVYVLARSLVHLFFVATGLPAGGFRADRYLREVVENTDFRKYDDGLRMTIDCAPVLADRLEARLTEAEAAGIARFGTHRQNAALLTCVVHSALEPDHLHFVDGAMGGYAAAAAALKRKHDVPVLHQ
jgi:hypothetical protein